MPATSHIKCWDVYFWYHHPACRILIPQPGIEPLAPQQWKHVVLTTGLPGNSWDRFSSDLFVFMKPASLMAQTVKNLPARWEAWVQSLSREDLPEGGDDNTLQYSCLENPMDKGGQPSYHYLCVLCCLNWYFLL